jgi:hypothetical protein
MNTVAGEIPPELAEADRAEKIRIVGDAYRTTMEDYTRASPCPCPVRRSLRSSIRQYNAFIRIGTIPERGRLKFSATRI